MLLPCHPWNDRPSMQMNHTDDVHWYISEWYDVMVYPLAVFTWWIIADSDRACNANRIHSSWLFPLHLSSFRPLHPLPLTFYSLPLLICRILPVLQHSVLPRNARVPMNSEYRRGREDDDGDHPSDMHQLMLYTCIVYCNVIRVYVPHSSVT